MFHCHKEQCPIQMFKCTLTATTGNKLLMKEIPSLSSTNWYLCLRRAINKMDKAKETRLHRKIKIESTRVAEQSTKKEH